MNYHKITFSHDHPRLILQRGWDALDEIEQAVAARLDMSAVLDVVGRPIARSSYVVTFIEQCVECVKDKRFVVRFRVGTCDCRRSSKARVKAAVKIKRRIMKLGTKWIRQQAITLLVIKRIVGVAAKIESVESRAIVRV